MCQAFRGALSRLKTRRQPEGFSATPLDVQDPPSIEELRRSLFESTYSVPIPVEVEADEVKVAFVVSAIRPRYAETPGRIGQPPIAAHETPDWEFDGWVPKSGFDPFREVAWVRLRLVSDGVGGIDRGELRRIPRPER